MGDRGPTPRRDDERRRRNAPDHPIVKLTAAELALLPFEIDLEPSPPEVGEEWPEVLQDLWDALQKDPARKWMTAADWALTKVVMEITALAMGAKDENGDLIGVNGSQQAALLKHMSSIGITEAARLRLQKEITLFPIRPVDTEGNVTDIATARRGAVE